MSAAANTAFVPTVNGRGTLSYHGFSIKGDMRWYRASKYTKYAPMLVITMFFGAVLQLVLGAIWITQVEGDMEM